MPSNDARIREYTIARMDAGDTFDFEDVADDLDLHFADVWPVLDAMIAEGLVMEERDADD